MRIKVQTIIRFDDGREETSEVCCIDKDHERFETIGLRLDEAKTILKNLGSPQIGGETE
jgi:hypothetical protein